MSCNGKFDTPAAREHSLEPHPTHLRHEEENAARRAEGYLLVPRLTTEPKKDFSALAPHLRPHIRVGNRFVPVDGGKYLSHLEEKSRPVQYRGAKHRNGKTGTSVRWCKSPLVRHTVTVAPWSNDYLFVGVQRDPEHVAALVIAWARKLIPCIEAAHPGCRVESFNWHFRNGILHVDFALARVVDGRMVAPDGFGWLGDWDVAVDRQRRCGVFWGPHDAKHVQNHRKRASRGWEGPPLDLLIARQLDEFCAMDLPGLNNFQHAYVSDLMARRTNAVGAEKRRLRDALVAIEQAERLTAPPQIQILPSNEKGLTK